MDISQQLRQVNDRLAQGQGWIGYRYSKNSRGERVQSKTLYYALYQNGKQKFVRTGSNDPEHVYRELLAARNHSTQGHRLLPSEVSRIRYEHIRQGYVADRQGQRLRGLEFLDDFFRGRRVTEITTDLIRKYVALRRRQLGKDDAEEVNHDPTIRRELNTLRAMFNLAKKEGKLGSADVPHFPMPKDSEPAGAYIDPAAFQKILDALPKIGAKQRRKGRNSDLRPFFTFLYATGCRLDAARKITWDMVSRECDVIKIPGKLVKTKDPLIFVLDGNLLEPVAAILKKMFRMEHAKVLDSTNYRAEWGRACAKAGFGTFDPETRQRTGFRIHDCRVSAAVNLVDAGVPEDIVMKIGGWKTKSMFSRYNVMNPERIRKAMVKGGQYVATKMNGVAQ